MFFPSSVPSTPSHTRATPNPGGRRAPGSGRRTKLRPRTHDNSTRRAGPHNSTQRAPRRGPSRGPGQPGARVRPPRTPTPAAQARARSTEDHGQPPRPGPSEARREPLTHPRCCSAAGTAAPAATWRGRRSAAQRRRCPTASVRPRPSLRPRPLADLATPLPSQAGGLSQVLQAPD